MKFGKSLLLMLTLVLPAATVAAQAAPVTDAPPCSLATLNGTYGVWEQGTIAPAPPELPIPIVMAALATYDGAGNLSGTFQASLGGLPVPGTFSGTYTVASDCTYTETFVADPPGGAPLHVSGVITGQGTFREIHYIYTDLGRVISGVAKKTPPGGCSLTTLQGKYTVFGNGTILVPGQPALAVNHVGPFTADGSGHISGGEDLSLGGFALQDTFTAEAAVDPACTVTLVITDSTGLVVHEWGTLTGEGRSQEYHAIGTDLGWVFAETAKKH